MISNLRKAARDRQTVAIGGGEFGPAECKLAADLMDDAPMLRRALARLTAQYGLLLDDMEELAWNVSTDAEEAYSAARSALHLTAGWAE